MAGGEVSFEPPFRSLDHLVGDGEKPWWEAEAECPGGVEVDHELELARLYDRQVGRLLALENPASIDAGLALGLGKTRSVAHQTAGTVAKISAPMFLASRDHTRR